MCGRTCRHKLKALEFDCECNRSMSQLAMMAVAYAVAVPFTREERLKRDDVMRLETHVWHVKRMRMERRWGYLLPTSLTRKPSKAVWKAGKL